MEETSQKILVITGPTATGKTGIAIELANRLEGEIISADSRQVYKLMDIGTAKPTEEQRQEVPHHLIDIVYPDQAYSAGLFARDAKNVIEQILNRRKLPIIVGGTGLYLKALTQGLFQGPGANMELREKLNQEAQAKGIEALYRELAGFDPQTASKISPKDRIRIIRAIEVYRLTGKSISCWQRKSSSDSSHHRFVSFGIDMERNRLYERINQRIDKMMQDGFLAEVENLLRLGYSFELPALRTFGYLDMLEHIQGKVELQAAVDKFKQKTRNYAKRQLTWFSHQIRLTWVDARRVEPVNEISESFLRA